MPRKKHTRTEPEAVPFASLESVNDEAELDEDGEVPIDKARELGAVDPESVRINQRNKKLLAGKAAGKSIRWNEDDIFNIFDSIVLGWPYKTLSIMCKSMDGVPETFPIYGFPKDSTELYEAILKKHGRHQAARYSVTVRQANEYRGMATAYMPDTTAEPISPPQPQQQPWQPNQGPSQQPQQQQSWQPNQAPPQGYAPQQQAPQQPQQLDVAQAIGLQKQLSDMQHQIAALLQGVSPGLSSQGVGQPPPPQQPQVARPAIQPPPGYVIVISPDGQQIMVPASQMGLGTPPAPAQPVPPPQAPLTPQQQFQGAVGIMRDALGAAAQMQALVPQAAPAAATDPEEADPTKILKLGDYNVIQNKDDGSMRILDTIVLNVPKILEIASKERETFLQRQQAAQNPGQQPQQLPQQTQQGPLGSPVMP